MRRYRILLFILSIPIILYILWISIRNKDFRFLLQRLGFQYKKSELSPYWFHAASVGELNAVLPLIQKINEKHRIILTTNTPSSAKQAKNILPNNIEHIYCPIDWQWAISNYINNIQPRALYIVETELWPNLFSICKSKNIPITIINGRLSERTIHSADWVKRIYSECLKLAQAILTRSNLDSQRFIELGAPSSIVKTIGNIKYHPQNKFKETTAFKTLKPYVIAASTRDEEEKLIVAAWKESTTNLGNYLLIIVPRHPQRLSTIISQLRPFNLNIAIRSKKESITDSTHVYIADTFGELVSFLKGSEFVIMGGSLVDKGGQNILEVAHAEKTVIFGPSMFNFRDEAKLFIENGAGIQVNNIDSLPETIHLLLMHPEKLKSYQDNAIRLMHQHRNILDKYIAQMNL